MPVRSMRSRLSRAGSTRSSSPLRSSSNNKSPARRNRRSRHNRSRLRSQRKHSKTLPRRRTETTELASLLEARNLAKRFGQRAAVADISVEVRSGEIVGLLGPNGAGKTTSFYMIVGLIRADSGTILLDGETLTERPMHERARLGLGYLPQEASVFRGLS